MVTRNAALESYQFVCLTCSCKTSARAVRTHYLSSRCDDGLVFSSTYMPSGYEISTHNLRLFRRAMFFLVDDAVMVVEGVWGVPMVRKDPSL